jgi:hypothetical protein
VALSNKSSGIVSDNRVVADAATQSVIKLLANFVTADPTQSIIAGPNGPPAGLASWSLNTGAYTDSRGTVWALAAGGHIITSGIPLPPNASSVSYDVKWVGAGCAGPPIPVPPNCTPSISVTVNWTN